MEKSHVYKTIKIVQHAFFKEEEVKQSGNIKF